MRAIVTEDDVRRLVDALTKEQQQTAALRALVGRIQSEADSTKKRYGGCGVCREPWEFHRPDCFVGRVVALLADAGQAGEEWRALVRCADFMADLVTGPWAKAIEVALSGMNVVEVATELTSAVERARQR